MFAPDILDAATALLAVCRGKGLRIVTAESCTGGLICAALTEIAGSSDVLERGFVTYSNDAKMEAIGVPSSIIRSYGAVSEECARAMANGALEHARAHIAIAVTGIAGPGGGSRKRPVGTVHMAVASTFDTTHRHCTFGEIGRSEVRIHTMRAALEMASDMAGRLPSKLL